MKNRRGRMWGAWLFAGLLAGIAFLPLCDLNFDCGCVWPGRGGASHCDIQIAGAPDCPWCDQPAWAAVTVILSYGAGLLAAAGLARRASFPWVVVGSLAVLVTAIMLCGVATSLLTNRPILAGLFSMAQG